MEPPSTIWRPVTGTVTVRWLTEPSEILKAYQLRYQVYVTEMTKPYAAADHNARTLSDAADEYSMILGAFAGDNLAGTGRCAAVDAPYVRACLARGLLVDRWATIVPAARLLVCSRLVVAQRFRGRSRVSSALIEAMYVVSRELSIAVGLCSTRTSLVPFFERYGFRCYGEPFIDDQSNSEQVPMALLCEDIDHLEFTQSPFRRHALRYDNHPPDKAWIAALRAPTVLNQQRDHGSR